MIKIAVIDKPNSDDGEEPTPIQPSFKEVIPGCLVDEPYPDPITEVGCPY